MNDGMEEISTDENENTEHVSAVKRKRSVQAATPYQLKLTKQLIEDQMFKDWLIANPKAKSQPYCRLCHKALKASNRRDLVKHGESNSHRSQVNQSKGQLSLDNLSALKKISSKQEAAKGLELALAATIAKENLPIRVMDKIPKILKKHVHDSEIISNIACGRTKTSGLIKNVLAPYGEKCLANILKTAAFSIIVDESTDRTINKYLVILVRYFCKASRKPIEAFYSIPQITDGSASSLKFIIMREFEKNKVPITNMIGFASDNASVMTGRHGGLSTLLKEEVPWIAVFGCICHSFALCAEAAIKKIDPGVMSFANDIYNFIGGSSKRKQEYLECQQFVDVARHMILYPSRTRWLVMEQVCKRLVEQWPAMNLYFQSYLAENDKTAKGLYQALNNIQIKLFYNFLAFILEDVNAMNLEFQSEDVKIHKYLEIVQNGLQTIMKNFIPARLLKEFSCFEIDLNNPRNVKPLSEIYYGAKVQLIITQASEGDQQSITSFQVRALAFYQELCHQIRARINSKDLLLQQLKVVSPKVALSGEISSIVQVYLRFQNVLPLDMQTLDSQWRAIPFIPNVNESFDHYLKLKKNEALKNKKTRESSFINLIEASACSLSDCSSSDENENTTSHHHSSQSLLAKIENVDPNEFWNFIEEQSTPFDNFDAVVAFMRMLMSLPHSSASAERQFSKLKLIRTPLRTKMSPNTLNALMHVDQYVDEVSSWNIPSDLIKMAKEWKTKPSNV